MSDSALVNNPYVRSGPNSSVGITQPVSEGEGFDIINQLSVGNSNNITTTYTAGTSSVPPNYSLSIPTSTITSIGGTGPVTIDTSSGVFALGVLGSLVANILQTIIVGGSIGMIPSSPTISSAVTTYASSLATATSTSPWTLLLLPGIYTATGTVVIPPNVNIVPLAQSTSFINHPISITDTSSNDCITIITGIVMNDPTSAITVDSSGKTGGTFSLTIRDCDIRNGTNLTFTMRGLTSSPPGGNFYQDNVYLLDNRIVTSSTLMIAISGGITNFQNCRIRAISGTLAINATTTPGEITRVQLLNCTVSILFSQSSYAFTSLRGCILGGSWVVGQSSSTSSTLLITSCRPNADSNTIIPNPWTLTAYGTATVVITKTYLPYVLTRETTTTWSVAFSNFIPVSSGTQAPIDRPFRLTLLNPPTFSSLTAVSISLDIPLITAFEASAPSTGIQPQVTQCLTGNVERSQIGSTSTTSTITLNIISNATNGDKITMEVIPPPYSGISWYYP